MISTIKKILGVGPAVDFKELVKGGAIILDVRTKSEFSSGHVKGSLNIAVDQLASNLQRIPKDKVVITVCASGMRSATAKSLLISKGYKSVYNGGSWTGLLSKI